MKRLILITTALLAACQTNVPTTQRVDVPVSLPCIKSSQLPVRPKYESYLVDPSADDGTKVLAITRDWLRSRPYEAVLEQLARGCSL